MASVLNCGYSDAFIQLEREMTLISNNTITFIYSAMSHYVSVSLYLQQLYAQIG